VLDLYNARLDERIKRKKFVLERGLLDIRKQIKNEKKRTREEKEIYNALKIFARFQSQEDHEKLVNNLIRERMLRELIEQLKYFRGKGLVTLDQIEKYIEK
jgi:transcriptional adapter 2-alpha